MRSEDTCKGIAWTRRAVKNLCDTIRNGGSLNRADVYKRFEDYLANSFGFSVSISYQRSARRRLPQPYRKHPYTQVVHINCFVQEDGDEESAFDSTLRQISTAAVLVVTSPDLVDELSPDETYETFAKRYGSYAKLSQEVYGTLKESIRDFPFQKYES